MSQINSQEANVIRVKIETSSVKNYLYCIMSKMCKYINNCYLININNN